MSQKKEGTPNHYYRLDCHLIPIDFTMSVIKPIMKPDFWLKWKKLINPSRTTTILRDAQSAIFVLDCFEASTQFARLPEDVMACLCPRLEDLDVIPVGITTMGDLVIQETFELEIWNAITERVPPDTLQRVIDKAAIFQQERRERAMS
jgi:hypothetical protein